MATALTLYTAIATSTTLSTAQQLTSTAGATDTAYATSIGTGTGWVELLAVGTTTAVTPGASEPAPSGKGWMFDPTTLEGQEFVAGSWSVALKLSAAAAITGTPHLRVYKYNAGTYTLLGDFVGTSTTLGAATVYTLTSQSLSTLAFSTGDKVYVDCLLDITTGFTAASTVSVVEDSAATAVTTPGYTPTIPGTPGVPSATVRNGSVKLSWTAPTTGGTPTSYDIEVYVGGTLQETISTTATSYTVTGLTNGTAYTFAVAGVNTAGTGAYSAQSTAATPRNAVFFEYMSHGIGVSTAATSTTDSLNALVAGGLDIVQVQTNTGTCTGVSHSASNAPVYHKLVSVANPGSGELSLWYGYWATPGSGTTTITFSTSTLARVNGGMFSGTDATNPIFASGTAAAAGTAISTMVEGPITANMAIVSLLGDPSTTSTYAPTLPAGYTNIHQYYAGCDADIAYHIPPAESSESTSWTTNVSLNNAAISAALQPIVPTPPTQVVATPSNDEVGLDWTLPSITATSYIVNVYQGGVLQHSYATGSANPWYTVGGLTNGTTYSFTVQSVGSDGTSAESTAISCTPGTLAGGALVQQISRNQSGATQTLAFPNAVTAGNLLVVSAAQGTATAVSDSLGTTYTQVPFTQSQTGFLWYGVALTSGANTVTITIPAATGSTPMAYEFSGLAGTLDVAADIDSSHSAVTSMPVLATPNTTVGGIAVAHLGYLSTTQGTPITQGDLWVVGETDDYESHIWANTIGPGTPVTGIFHLGTPGAYHMQVAVFSHAAPPTQLTATIPSSGSLAARTTYGLRFSASLPSSASLVASLRGGAHNALNATVSSRVAWHATLSSLIAVPPGFSVLEGSLGSAFGAASKQAISAVPLISPLFVNGHEYGPQYASTDDNGFWELPLPSGAICDPPYVTWRITVGNGSWTGAVPQDGKLHNLRDLGWPSVAASFTSHLGGLSATLHSAASLSATIHVPGHLTASITGNATLATALPIQGLLLTANVLSRGTLGAAMTGTASPLISLQGVITGNPGLSIAFAPPSLQLAMVFNYHCAAPPNSDENGITYVWGSTWPTGGAQQHEYYMPWSQAIHSTPASGGSTYFTLSWLQANHPDWILYQSDQTTVAAYIYNGTPPNPTPVDYTNPAVQQWVANNDAIPALQAGYTGISFDDNPSYNMFNAAGHFDASGTWVAQYSGAVNDAAWSSAQASALTAIANLCQAAMPGSTFTINNGYFDTSTQYSTASNIWGVCVNAPGVTGVFDERGFEIYSTGTSLTNQPDWWTNKMAALEGVAQTRALVLCYQEGYTITANMTTTYNGTTPVATARADLQWALANYFLCRGDRTYFFWGASSQYGYAAIPQDEFTTVAAMGSPTNTYYASQNVYMRDYTGGLAIVNPNSTTTYTVTLAAGVYKDLYGNQLNSVSLGPGAGIVLLKV